MRYPLAAWQPSPNHNKGRGGAVINRIVIHQTDGHERLDRAIEHLCNAETDKRVSAHFVVGRGGEVAQLVDLEDTAWHCTGWNKISVGIEHVARTPGELGKADPGLPLTEPQLAASARLVAWLRRELLLPLDAVVPHCSSPVTTHKDCGRDVKVGGIWDWDDYLGKVEGASQRSVSYEANATPSAGSGRAPCSPRPGPGTEGA